MPANIKSVLKRNDLFKIHFWCDWLRQQELTYFAMTGQTGIDALLFFRPKAPKELIKSAEEPKPSPHTWPTPQFKNHRSVQKPTRWSGCGRNPKQRWSAWRTSGPLSESAGPSSPGSQTALLPTHAPTPGTCRHTGETTVRFKMLISKRQEEDKGNKLRKTINLTSDTLKLLDTANLWCWILGPQYQDEILWFIFFYVLSDNLPVYSGSCFITALKHFGEYFS